MRTLKHLAFSAWFVVALTSTALAQSRIPWITDIQVARQMAEKQRRLVLLHFWTESCPPCQRLERYVFNQPELIRAVSTGFVPVKINAQQSPGLAEYYKVDQVPTDVIVDPSGREVFRSTSPQEANRYIAMLDGVKAHNSVGLQMPADSLAPEPAEPVRQTAGGDTQFAMDQASRGGDFQAAGNRGAGFSTGASEPLTRSAEPAAPRRALVQNPYSNPLQQEVPKETATNIAPPYANSYAPESTAPSSAGDSSAATTQWDQGRQGSTAPSPTMGGYQLPSQNRSLPAQNPQQPVTQQSRPSTYPGASSAYNQNAPGAANSYTPNSGAGPQWNAAAASPNNRPWEANPAGDYRNPASSPTAPRIASRTPQQRAAAPPAVGGQPPVALDGYCPVTLVHRSQWSKGDSRWGAVHQGRVYLFATAQDQQQFLSTPERYSPALAGCDPVRFVDSGQRVDGKREHGVFYRDRIYLFSDEATLQHFGSRPDHYVAAAEQASNQGPHR